MKLYFIKDRLPLSLSRNGNDPTRFVEALLESREREGDKRKGEEESARPSEKSTVSSAIISPWSPQPGFYLPTLAVELQTQCARRIPRDVSEREAM